MSVLKTKKILEDVHPLDIIKEVKKWPVLYQKNNPERLNFHFKTKIWYEVAKNLIKNWDGMSDSEKEIKVLELSKKWRNLRDTFRRQVEIEKKIREGFPIKKRRYVYFKQMMFLMPHVRGDERDDDDDDGPPPPGPADRPRSRARRFRPRPPPADPHPTPHPASDAAPGTDIDEDRHFLMSLIPSFKRMSDDEKLTAKVEILKVIQQVRSSKIEFASPATAFIEEPSRGMTEVKVEMSPEGMDACDDSDEANSDIT